jgi:serine/threonine protein kinase
MEEFSQGHPERNASGRGDGEVAPHSPLELTTQTDISGRAVLLPESSTAINDDGFLANPTAALMLRPDSVLCQRYEIKRILGEGGIGAVYQARDRELNRVVALKVIRPELSRNQAIIDRFKRELLLATQVTHRNVIRIYDLSEAEGMKFITMEFVEGEDLGRLIQQKKKLATQEAVEIILQVCRALDATHSVGIIHRDLKPRNIMRDKSGRIVVMDFGLARTFAGDGMTQTGALVGTVDYMSPEQALGKDLDQRSDLFTLGLIFYELLTGKMPFKADNMVASLESRPFHTPSAEQHRRQVHGSGY